jgi:uncharacterized protein YoaH (UPF0181 family)
MARRSTPERLHEARREATRQRLMSEGESPGQAERLIAQWELQAARVGLERDGQYWESGWAWMLAQRR